MERLGASPDDVWIRDTTARPLPPLTPDDLATFLPDMREASIRGGMISLTAAGDTYDFRADRLIELGTGYRVYARFDATEPALGAAIYNRETSSANHQGYRPGELVCWAAYEVPGPQAVLTSVQDPRGIDAQTVQERYGVDEDTGRAGRKSQLRLARTEFRALPKPGQPAVRTATARDGRGNVAAASNFTRSESRTPTDPQPRGLHPTSDRMRDSFHASGPFLSDRSRQPSAPAESGETEHTTRRCTAEEETVERVESSRFVERHETIDEIERL